MQHFLTLSQAEQKELVSTCGNLLISSSQGDTVMTFYRLYEFFVKIIQEGNDREKIEVFPNLDNFSIYGTNQ